MVRRTGYLLTVTVLLGSPMGIRAQSGSASPPVTYELMINGESFLIEANRLVKLQSPKRPEINYEVALRVAPTQRLRLNSVQFDYDWLIKIRDDGKPQQRTARLTHELGLFSMLITDLGGPLKDDALDEALKIVTGSVLESFRESKVTDLDVGEPQDRSFGGVDTKAVSGRGVVIHHRTGQNIGHTCLIYVLNGPTFAVTCVVQYLDRDFDDAKPFLKKTLDSFRPI